MNTPPPDKSAVPQMATAVPCSTVTTASVKSVSEPTSWAIQRQFGNILKETEELSNRLTYTGQMYDGVAGQYYLRARFYNPAIGRFLQEDTYRGDGRNLYTYCANNPVMYYDPSGHGLCPQALQQLGNDNSATDPYARTDFVTVSGERTIDQGHSYERGVRDLYGDVPFAPCQYEAKINGQTVKGAADNVILSDNIGTEAK